MLRKISIKGLMEPWKENFRKHPSLPFVTESSSISLDMLNQFLSAAQLQCPGFNGIRIYFIRYDKKNDNLTEDNPHLRLLPGTDLSQVSLAFVPVKNFNPATLQGEDFTEGDRILTLSFCHPSEKDSKAIGTGHCPPTCHPPQDDQDNL